MNRSRVALVALGLLVGAWWFVPRPQTTTPDFPVSSSPAPESSRNESEGDAPPHLANEATGEKPELRLASRVEDQLVAAIERESGRAITPRDREFLLEHLSRIWAQEATDAQTPSERLERSDIINDADAALRARFGMGVHNLLLELNADRIQEVRPTDLETVPGA